MICTHFADEETEAEASVRRVAGSNIAQIIDPQDPRRRDHRAPGKHCRMLRTGQGSQDGRFSPLEATLVGLADCEVGHMGARLVLPLQLSQVHFLVYKHKGRARDNLQGPFQL